MKNKRPFYKFLIICFLASLSQQIRHKQFLKNNECQKYYKAIAENLIGLTFNQIQIFSKEHVIFEINTEFNNIF